MADQPECEKAPRIMADGKTLIFSSNRLGGKGGFDMYQSVLNDLESGHHRFRSIM